MTVTNTPRLGLHRWSEDTDPWDRSEWDEDNATLDALVAIAVQGTEAARPAPAIPRRLYWATNTQKLFLDTGTAWHAILIGGTAHANEVKADAGTMAGATVGAALTALTAGKVNGSEFNEHTAGTGARHTAATVTVSPVGAISSTNVQAALVELDGEKHPRITPTNAYTVAGAVARTIPNFTTTKKPDSYTEPPTALTAAATMADLNDLRAAYQALAINHDALRGALAAIVTDLKAAGILL